jgi:MFS family permease
MFAMGYSLSAWIGFGCFFLTLSGSHSSFAWRFPLAFQIVPALMLLLCSVWLPFSPRWLLQRGREREAHDVIRRLHHTKGDPHETIAVKEFVQMKRQLEMDRQIRQVTSSFEVFKTAPNRRRLWVGFSLMFGNQMTGVLIIANYGVLLVSFRESSRHRCRISSNRHPSTLRWA